jgi:hypothetical protein
MANKLDEHQTQLFYQQIMAGDKDKKIAVIHRIYETGFIAATEFLEDVDDNMVCVGNRVCENLSEVLKAEFLAEVFDKFSEKQFRELLK